MTLTEKIEQVFRCFLDAGVRELVLDCRSRSGVTHEVLPLVREHFAAGLPIGLMKLLLEGLHVRLIPAATAHRALQPLPVAIVLWRPTCKFRQIRGGKWGHAVDQAARAAVLDSLATFPAPSFLIDGGHELVAGWRLDRALAPKHAAAALEQLATRAGADVSAVRDLSTFSFPLSGPIRNWNGDPVEPVQILEVDPERCYALDDLNPQMEHKNVEEPSTGNSATAGRTGRARAAAIA